MCLYRYRRCRSFSVPALSPLSGKENWLRETILVTLIKSRCSEAVSDGGKVEGARTAQKAFRARGVVASRGWCHNIWSLGQWALLTLWVETQLILVGHHLVRNVDSAFITLSGKPLWVASLHARHAQSATLWLLPEGSVVWLIIIIIIIIIIIKCILAQDKAFELHHKFRR